MSFTRLLFSNLFFHLRGNVAVLLGVVVGATVLTGALLVGDSLRGSLRDITERQLGWVDFALVNKRFFRTDLAEELPATKKAPAILLQVAAAKKLPGKKTTLRARKVTLLGVDEGFWSESELAAIDLPKDWWNPPEFPFVDVERNGVILNAALADDLRANVGDMITLTLQKISAAPRETILGRRKTNDVVDRLTMPVKAILPAEHFGSQFTLNPNPESPRNAFVSLRLLQEMLRDPDRKERPLPARPINAIFAAGADRESLQNHILQYQRLADWGLVLRKPRRKFGKKPPAYLSLETPEMFLSPAAKEAVAAAGLEYAPTLAYLINNMTTREHLVGTAAALLSPPVTPALARDAFRYYGPSQAPYFISAALEPTLPPPFGRFLPLELQSLADDEILLVNWENSPFQDLSPGTKLILRYFDPEQEGRIEEKSVQLRLAVTVPIKGPTNDMHLTPVFPGVTDKRSLTGLGGWDPPFPFQEWLVSEDDEDYWSAYRTTPKAYVNLKTGQKLWGSRFGNITSIRIDPQDKSPKEIAASIERQLKPEEGGLVFQEVRKNKLDASRGGGFDFGQLFLGFSFFLIVAALMLIGLLFRLNVDRRAKEMGLLLAVGNSHGFVRRLLLAEGAIVTLIGGILGTFVALAYTNLLLDYLALKWPGGLSRSLLRLHWTWLSLSIGFVAAVGTSLLTILWTTRVLSKVPPRALLGGETIETLPMAAARRPLWGLIVAGVGILGAIGFLAMGLYAGNHEMQAGGFMGSGFMLLMTGLAVVWMWLRRMRPQPITQHGLMGLIKLGTRNAGRRPVRSLLTMGLLAAATFLVVSVQVFNRHADEHFLDKDGGSGGFPLLAETDVPVFEKPVADGVTLHPFRVKAGDDVSCLNLYKPQEPRIFGVPNSIIARGGFHFAGHETIPGDGENPWSLLTAKRTDGAIPVFGEKNTVTWMLGSGLGGVVETKNDRGETVKLHIAGLLQDSVFQGELLMSGQNFRKLCPRREGYQFFLIDAAPDKLKETKAQLETALAAFGTEVTLCKDRVERFLAVENMYLSMFQALGGLGLLLGSLGLAVVLLRGVWERRGELALLRALGFRRSSLGWMVMAENAYLLFLGLAVGTIAALFSVAPHLAIGAAVPWWQVMVLLVLVTLSGMTAGTLAAAMTLRAPLLPALRKE